MLDAIAGARPRPETGRRPDRDRSPVRVSIITPAFNEASNLPALYDRLVPALDATGAAWDWLIVDDHSGDGTFEAIERLAAADARVAGLRLSRNSGSHTAIACALHHVDGDAAVMMAADLQDPPEAVAAMLERWRGGAQVVWAVRRTLPGTAANAPFARLYYWIMRRLVGMAEMPARGADFFLVDRVVIDAFRQLRERNLSVLALITWLGFRQERLEYDKAERARGVSGWTLAKKMRLVVDSVTAFSAFPIRFCSYAGLALGVAAAIAAGAALALLEGTAAGLLLVAALAVGLTGLQLLALGIVGEYVWRGLDEARGRPAWFVERRTAPGSVLAPGARAENQVK